METKAAVDGCGSKKGRGVGSSHNEVKANDVCAQDLSNTQGVNAPVAGSLRVRQLYGDEDEIREMGIEVGTNNNPTKSGKQRIAAASNRLGISGRRGVVTSSRAMKRGRT